MRSFETDENLIEKIEGMTTEYIMCLQYEYIGSGMQGNKVLERDLETINALMPVGYRAEKH